LLALPSSLALLPFLPSSLALPLPLPLLTLLLRPLRSCRSAGTAKFSGTATFAGAAAFAAAFTGAVAASLPLCHCSLCRLCCTSLPPLLEGFT
jgi:hypothetical protein